CLPSAFWESGRGCRVASEEMQRQRLRLDIGLAANDLASLDEGDAQDILDEAGESYTDAASIHAASRVIALRRLRAQAASAVDYQQNNSSEKASQRFAHLTALLNEWQGKLDEAVSGGRGSGVKSGRTTRKPARL